MLSIFVGNYVPSNLSDEAVVDNVKVVDSQASIFFGLTNVLPRAKDNGRRRISILDSFPPKSSNNGINPFHKSLGE